jgi:hypothetical protein
MSLFLDSTIFIIDSSQAVSGTTSNFQFQLNMPRDKDYDRVCVLQAIIPKSYYLVNAPYNTMILSENGVQTTITLIPGNYNVISWKTLISALLTSSSSAGWTYSITFPNAISQVDTGKFTYTVSGNGGIQPLFIFPTLSLVYEQFGFAAESTNSFVGNSLVSSDVVKFQVEDVIFIHSNMSYNNDQSAQNDVLQEIYASSTPSFSNIIYQNSGAIEAYSKKLLTPNNNIYSFSLTDEKENLINLNGLNCVITIVVYKRDDINQLIARNLLLR